MPYTIRPHAKWLVITFSFGSSFCFSYFSAHQLLWGDASVFCSANNKHCITITSSIEDAFEDFSRFYAQFEEWLKTRQARGQWNSSRELTTFSSDEKWAESCVCLCTMINSRSREVFFCIKRRRLSFFHIRLPRHISSLYGASNWFKVIFTKVFHF